MALPSYVEKMLSGPVACLVLVCALRCVWLCAYPSTFSRCLFQRTQQLRVSGEEYGKYLKEDSKNGPGWKVVESAREQFRKAAAKPKATRSTKFIYHAINFRPSSVFLYRGSLDPLSDDVGELVSFIRSGRCPLPCVIVFPHPSEHGVKRANARVAMFLKHDNHRTSVVLHSHNFFPVDDRTWWTASSCAVFNAEQFLWEYAAQRFFNGPFDADTPPVHMFLLACMVILEQVRGPKEGEVRTDLENLKTLATHPKNGRWTTADLLKLYPVALKGAPDEIEGEVALRRRRLQKKARALQAKAKQ